MSLENSSHDMKTHTRVIKFIIYVAIGRWLKICVIGIALASTPWWSITVHDMISDLVDQRSSSLLPSYEYITIHTSNISVGTDDYRLIQKAVFLGIIANKTQSLNLARTVSRWYARRLLHPTIAVSIPRTTPSYQKISTTERQTLLQTIGTHDRDTSTIDVSSIHNTLTTPGNSTLNPIFADVYDKLKHEFLGSGTTVPTDDILIQWAIKGMTDAVGDVHSIYLVPTASKNFSDSIQGEFFGIGAYINIKEPGVLLISSTVDDSPAAKAGIKAWDHITAIDDYSITKDSDPDEAITKIKWPKGSSVTLTIRRWDEDKTITIVRDKISIKPLTTTEIDSNTILIHINSFSFGVDRLRSQAMNDIATMWYQKVIIDLRYNPGGSLDDVAHMLDYVVPKGEATVIIRSRDGKEVYRSNGTDPRTSLSNKKVIVLINKDSASASEILAGVIRDYLPNAQIVGETSYGKWSVQSLWDYSDGSSLKLTTAKWYTGKSDIHIDKKGIVPDTVVVDDPKTDRDEVIDRVQSH